MNDFLVYLLIAIIIVAVVLDRKRQKNFTPEQRMKYEEAKSYFSNKKLAKKSRKRERRHILNDSLLVWHFMKK